MNKRYLTKFLIKFIFILILLNLSLPNVVAYEGNLRNVNYDESVLSFKVEKSGQIIGKIAFNINETQNNITPQVVILPFTIERISKEGEFITVYKNIDSHHSLIIWFIEPNFKGYNEIKFVVKPEERNIEQILENVHANSKTHRGFLLKKRDGQTIKLYYRSNIADIEKIAMAIDQDPILGFRPQKISFEKPNDAIFLDINPNIIPINKDENFREFHSDIQYPYLLNGIFLQPTSQQKILIDSIAAIIISICLSLLTSYGIKNRKRIRIKVFYALIIILIFSLTYLGYLFFTNPILIGEKIPQIIFAILTPVITALLIKPKTN